MEILNKSEDNFSAAEFLVANNFFTSSIHCYYYSSFQLMNYILIHVIRFDSDEYRKNTKGRDSHNYLINLIRRNLIESGVDFRFINNELIN